MAKNVVLQFFYYISQTIQLSDIKFSMHVYADGIPIHAYFQVPTWFTFAAIDKKCILTQPGFKGNPLEIRTLF